MTITKDELLELFKAVSDQIHKDVDQELGQIKRYVDDRLAEMRNVRKPLPGRGMVQPCLMENRQIITVHMDHAGRFERLEETMPPLLNRSRLRMPTEHDERARRIAEIEEARRMFDRLADAPD